MSAADLAAVIASAVSATLAVLAIALSIVFYRMSSRLAESVRQSEQNLAAGVARLEKLFDTLYSDAQGLVRQAVDDLRGQNNGKSNGKNGDLPGEAQMAKLKRDIVHSVVESLRSGEMSLADRGEDRDIADLIDRTISQSRP